MYVRRKVLMHVRMSAQTTLQTYKHVSRNDSLRHNHRCINERTWAFSTHQYFVFSAHRSSTYMHRHALRMCEYFCVRVCAPTCQCVSL